MHVLRHRRPHTLEDLGWYGCLRNEEFFYCEMMILV